MKIKKTHILVIMGFALLCMSFKTGDTVYTKRNTTSLLDKPLITADAVSEVQWGTKLTVKDIKGRWLFVTGDGKSGWVYLGNVSENKPPKENKKDLLPFTAGSTSTSAAARGLSEISRDYAQRKSMEESARDVEWMENFSKKIGDDKVTGFMRENKKGEYCE